MPPTRRRRRRPRPDEEGHIWHMIDGSEDEEIFVPQHKISPSQRYNHAAAQERLRAMGAIPATRIDYRHAYSTDMEDGVLFLNDPPPFPADAPQSRPSIGTTGSHKKQRRHDSWRHFLDVALDTLAAAMNSRCSLPAATPCKCPPAAKKEHHVKVITLEGVHTQVLKSCSLHLAETLVAWQLFPSTPTRPVQAVPFGLLHLLQQLVLHSGLSVTGMAGALWGLHAIYQADLCSKKAPPPFGTGALRAAFDWFRASQRLVEDHVLGRPIARSLDQPLLDVRKLARKCPLCFGQLLARPSPTSPSAMHHSVYVAVDGNFSHKRQRRRDHGGATSQAPIAILPKAKVEAMRQRVAAAGMDAKAKCSANFRAADDGNKAINGPFDVTGLVMLVCRHDIPLMACDIDTPGERHYFALALLQELLRAIGPLVSTVGVLYDIACHMEGSIRRKDLLAPWSNKVHLAVPVFHAHAHDLACCLRFSPREIPRFGLNDGEGVERAWRAMANLVAKTRSMGARRRHLELDWQMSGLADLCRRPLFSWVSRRLDRIANELRMAIEKRASADWPNVHAARVTWRSGPRDEKVNLPNEGVDTTQAWKRGITKGTVLERGLLANARAGEPSPDHASMASLLAALRSHPSFLHEMLALHLTRIEKQGSMNEWMANLVPPGWDELARLEETLADLRSTPAKSRSAAIKRAGRVALQEKKVCDFRAKHTLWSVKPSDLEWAKARKNASKAAKALLEIAQKKRADIDTLHGQTGALLGHRMATKLNKKVQGLTRKFREQIRTYNDHCAAMERASPKGGLNSKPFAEGTDDAAVVTSLEAEHQRLASASLGLPWMLDSALMSAMQSTSMAAHCVEELEILRVEASGALAWIHAEGDALQARVVDFEGTSLQWHVRRLYRDLQGVHSEWRRAIEQHMAPGGALQDQRWRVLPNLIWSSSNIGPGESLAAAREGDEIVDDARSSASSEPNQSSGTDEEYD